MKDRIGSVKKFKQGFPEVINPPIHTRTHTPPHLLSAKLPEQGKPIRVKKVGEGKSLSD